MFYSDFSNKASDDDDEWDTDPDFVNTQNIKEGDTQLDETITNARVAVQTARAIATGEKVEETQYAPAPVARGPPRGGARGGGRGRGRGRGGGRGRGRGGGGGRGGAAPPPAAAPVAAKP